MVYIKNWTDFETAATDLYARSPTKVRYCVKFQPKTGHLVLKITDDVKCIKYKTFSSIILNRFDSLNLRLLSSMSNTKARPKTITTISASETPERGGTPAPAGASAAAPPSAVASGGQEGTKQGAQGKPNTGGKKKKKGKR
ncbi:signal recognition particle subunit SRP9 [Cryptococcus neoformans C23]|uniref:Signal recognition particle subunit SRP9 n=2 Tax=Cryptococcus neoformans TaxID=5207 RepID=A0A854QAT1_CRYNE|nr:signal recognition particle subunit SRP9 [Cryptococcus neoformans var. grubii H99]AUB25999.1 signal recognition particle subunit SRP9 [Cryptococcus neoformans var. grubii]OWZ30534.1 signal recognition particle subunit SRP9 [Cryptococcus neoformans var. grubii AD2-60a]OWZ42307.1 signal recognition particle subunit SRP9 [Cryptococcus neoformans var. grubii C23]OWZ53290.1 signal recognition particle subunit SRP9 [Cryptococcus neoformans var. grubii 125.91]OXC83665.1 signal recognition particle|eukprot:XP_012050537.1 signal recognition particle subunit SRP9 [Cryptococcus neoformans var. grubii H99]